MKNVFLAIAIFLAVTITACNSCGNGTGGDPNPVDTTGQDTIPVDSIPQDTLPVDSL